MITNVKPSEIEFKSSKNACPDVLQDISQVNILSVFLAIFKNGIVEFIQG